MTVDTFIIITTYIGSGVRDESFLEQRINILKYSTIPSLINQLDKNFIWCVYLDELNNPKHKLDELIKLLESYSKYIKIHICKYEPFLSDGSLCLDNRARSCSSKRYELYLNSVSYCREKGYLEGIQWISHLMLDDDDPILNRHIEWINKKVNEFKNDKPVIVINRNQYIFYLDQLSLISVESNKAMKGSCFIVYPIKLCVDINFHPYSIIETIDSNYEYKTKYGIECAVVKDDPTWIYFRHQLSTSAYSKEFIISKKEKVVEGYKNVTKILEFYGSRKLEKLINSLKSEHKSSEIVSWKIFRNSEKKKIVIIIDDNKTYQSALRLSIFLKNNFEINILMLDKNNMDNIFIKKHSSFFNANSCFLNKDDKSIILKITKYKPNYVLYFGSTNKLDRLEKFLNTNRYKYDIVNNQQTVHTVLGKKIKNQSKWKNNDLMDIYYRLVDVLLTK